MQRVLEHAAELDFGSFSFEELNDRGYRVVGSANTVRERLASYSRDLGFGLALALTHFGDMSNERTRTNMARFAQEVMPPLRKEFPGMV